MLRPLRFPSRRSERYAGIGHRQQRRRCQDVRGWSRGSKLSIGPRRPIGDAPQGAQWPGLEEVGRTVIASDLSDHGRSLRQHLERFHWRFAFRMLHRQVGHHVPFRMPWHSVHNVKPKPSCMTTGYRYAPTAKTPGWAGRKPALQRVRRRRNSNQETSTRGVKSNPVKTIPPDYTNAANSSKSEAHAASVQ